MGLTSRHQPNPFLGLGSGRRHQSENHDISFFGATLTPVFKMTLTLSTTLAMIHPQVPTVTLAIALTIPVKKISLLRSGLQGPTLPLAPALGLLANPDLALGTGKPLRGAGLGYALSKRIQARRQSSLQSRHALLATL